MSEEQEFKNPTDKLDVSDDIGKLIHWGSDQDLDLKLLKTGIPTLDYILGGGFARGRIIEIIGAFSSGKTYLTQVAIRAAQNEGMRCYLIDAERTYSKDWWQQSGIDTSKLGVASPTSGEKVADLAVGLVKAKADLVVLDSLAAISPTQEQEKDASGSTVGVQARLINRMLREITALNTNTIFFMINQTRSNIGVTYGNPETLPGGMGQQFFAWQIIRARRAGWLMGKLRGDEVRMGFNMEFTMEKNKQAPPWRKAVIPFWYKGGFDVASSILDFCTDNGVVEVRGGGNYYFEGEHLARGRNDMVKLLRENDELRGRLEATINGE
jgi:recombination protein RecA